MYSPLLEGWVVFEVNEFVLDLTSVCVRTGALQLPAKIVGYFEEGPVKALAGGGEVELAFSRPRTLAGLKQFFETQGLRANDRLRMSFEGSSNGVPSLKLVAERRERPKSNEASHPQAAGRAEARRPAGAAPVTVTYEESSPVVRAVRKVRIAAQPSERTDEAEMQPDAQRQARGSTNAWAPLDSVSREAVKPGATEADRLTNVRVVHRGRGSTNHAVTTEDVVVSADTAAPEAIAAPRDGGGRPSLPVEVRGSSAAVVADQAAARRTSSPLLARFGVRFWSDRGAARPVGQGAPEQITEEDFIPREAVSEQPALILAAEESVSPQELPAASAKAAQLPVNPSAPVESPVAEAVSVGSAAASHHEHQAFEAFLQDPQERPADVRPSALWRKAARGNTPARPVQREVTPLTVPAEDVPTRATTGDRSATRPADPVSEALARGEVRVAPLRSADAAEQTETISVSSDQPLRVDDVLPQINKYLLRPQTPAIVQTVTLANELGLELALAERAMERLSEDRDRFNQIRPGAYMIRRAAGP